MPFPAIELTLADGTKTVWANPGDALLGWMLVSQGVLELRFVPDNGLQFTGCQRYWAYASAPNEYVFGAHKPAQDEGTPNFVPESFTELRFHRNGTLLEVRYPTTIPPGALILRWPYG